MGTSKKISLAVLGALCCLQVSGVAMAAHDDTPPEPAADHTKQHVSSGIIAEEDKPTASLAVMAMSKYVWRGFELSKDSVVIQPSMTVAYKGFSANVWGNVDTDFYLPGTTNFETNYWNETDFTLAYDWTMGPVGLTAGYIYYGLDGIPDTQEVFAKAALHVLLTPTLAVYRDYDHLAGWYATFGVSHTLPLTEQIGLSLGAQVGYLSADDKSSYPELDGVGGNVTGAYSGFHDGVLSASVAIPVVEYITITPMVMYSFPLTSDAGDLIETTSFDFIRSGRGGDNDFVYGGVTASLAF